jgi:hypothetical protein
VGDPTGWESEESNVNTIQLLFKQVEMYESYRSQLGKAVTVNGSLVHGFSQHHHTKVMLQVTDITRKE